jgi:hypothetical protein
MLGTRKHSFLTRCKYCVVSSGVDRFIWHLGRVITVFPPHKYYEFFKNQNYLLNCTGFFAQQFKTCWARKIKFPNVNFVIYFAASRTQPF